jgi:ParB family transcriptional regulator, chromosome partitioning protein
MSGRASGGGRRRPLGRGLAALFGEAQAGPATSGGTSRLVPIAAIRPGPLQPRRIFAEAELDMLAQSIREQGVLQPLLLRPPADGAAGFELVAGERRWRAAQRIGLHEVPAVVKALGDAEAIEVALVENLQREDLTALEEAAAYRRLIDEHGRTQSALAEAVGKSRSHIANTLRLLSLPEAVRCPLEDGTLSAGHARALLGAADPAALASEVLRRGLNVRATERLVQRQAAPRRRPLRPAHDADHAALERELGLHLGLRVSLVERPRGGALTLHYKSLEQLDRILRLLRAG